MEAYERDSQMLKQNATICSEKGTLKWITEKAKANYDWLNYCKVDKKDDKGCQSLMHISLRPEKIFPVSEDVGPEINWMSQSENRELD